MLQGCWIFSPRRRMSGLISCQRCPTTTRGPRAVSAGGRRAHPHVFWWSAPCHVVKNPPPADQNHDDLWWNDGRKRRFAAPPECDAISSVAVVCSQDGRAPREGQTDPREGNTADEWKRANS